MKKYLDSSQKGIQWLASQLTASGSYGDNIRDIASYYKSPYLFHLLGDKKRSNQLMNFIKERFMQQDGDFANSPEVKSENAAFTEYWAYTNGWITMAAKSMERADVADPGYRYLKTYHHPELGGFTTNKPYGEGNDVVDALTTAHLGRVAFDLWRYGSS